MPQVKYHFRDAVTGETWAEEDVLVSNVNCNFYAEQRNNEWNDLRPEHEHERVLDKVEVLNPFVHCHEWIKTIDGKKHGSRDFFQCMVCQITGHRKPGDTGAIIRDKLYDADKYFYCHEPLRRLKKFAPKPKAFMPQLKTL